MPIKTNKHRENMENISKGLDEIPSCNYSRLCNKWIVKDNNDSECRILNDNKTVQKHDDQLTSEEKEDINPGLSHGEGL